MLADHESGAANILVRVGAEPPEMLYPVDAGYRFNRETGVPRISAITLPAITAEPDRLYDRLALTVPRFAPGPVATHYQRLFDLLALWHGRQRWVERSGASGFFIDQLVSAFPQARYAYLTRDLDATSASMSRHPFFQLAALRMEFLRRCRADVFAGEEPKRPVPADLLPLLPARFTKAALDSWSPSRANFRLLTAYQDGRIRAALKALPRDQVHVLRYEDLTRDPIAEFRKLADFFGLARADEWACRAAELVEPRLPLTDNSPPAFTG